MAFKIPNFYQQQKQHAFAKGPEVSNVPSPLNRGRGSSSTSEETPKPKRSFDEAYNKRDMTTYGKMNKDEYIKEAKRQKKSKSEGKGYDAPSKPITKAKVTKTKPTETKPVETKDKVVKNEEPKNRRQKRADKIKKRKEKKKAIKKVKDSGLKGKEKREAKRAVREKVGKTKVGKFLKKAKDKVVGDALGNEVKKDSPANKEFIDPDAKKRKEARNKKASIKKGTEESAKMTSPLNDKTGSKTIGEHMMTPTKHAKHVSTVHARHEDAKARVAEKKKSIK